MILKANGAELGINKPFEMFWATGALSSFLDNTPTYLVFLTTAGALGFKSGVVTTLGSVPVKMLEAISCGAVFMVACILSSGIYTGYACVLYVRGRVMSENINREILYRTCQSYL